MRRASVILPAHNEAATIERSLDPFRGQDAEVIVVVSGDDGTEDLAEAHPACDRVLRDTEETGPGAARNQGARAAEGEVLLFTDADTVVPEDWVDMHVRHYANAEVVGVGGPIRPLEGGLKHRVMFKLLSDWWYRASWLVGFVQVSGWNASYRRGPFLEAGGYDEEMAFMEDTEHSLRMKEYGKVAYDPTCWVKTSARRQEGQGYLPLFWQYFKAYVNHYLLDRELGSSYFTSDSEVDPEETYEEQF